MAVLRHAPLPLPDTSGLALRGRPRAGDTQADGARSIARSVGPDRRRWCAARRAPAGPRVREAVLRPGIRLGHRPARPCHDSGQQAQRHLRHDHRHEQADLLAEPDPHQHRIVGRELLRRSPDRGRIAGIGDVRPADRRRVRLLPGSRRPQLLPHRRERDEPEAPEGVRQRRRHHDGEDWRLRGVEDHPRGTLRALPRDLLRHHRGPALASVRAARRHHRSVHPDDRNLHRHHPAGPRRPVRQPVEGGRDHRLRDGLPTGRELLLHAPRELEDDGRQPRHRPRRRLRRCRNLGSARRPDRHPTRGCWSGHHGDLQDGLRPSPRGSPTRGAHAQTRHRRRATSPSQDRISSDTERPTSGPDTQLPRWWRKDADDDRRDTAGDDSHRDGASSACSRPLSSSWCSTPP